MATLLSEGEVALRLADAVKQSGGGETSPAVTDSPKGPKRFPLTSTVVDSLVGFIRNPTERWYLGFPEFDLATRGVGRGEVLMVLGRSHTGKSQILLNSIVWNLVNHHDNHAVIFSLDEPRELVLMKMFCLLKGRSSEDVEDSIKAGDKDTLSDLERAATQELSRVAIVDEAIHLDEMARVLDEARAWWGVDPNFCMIDYLELLPGGDSDAAGVTGKAQAVKRWAKEQRVPLGLVHQSGRGSSPPGQAAGLYGGRYGGEQEAIFVLEVYRKKDRGDLSHWETQYHENSVNMNLCKNKRTAKLLDQTYYMDPVCGHVHPYHEELIPDTTRT
jgi:KaiC/GvpD/RAD55 family RecA-like ATPase|tara:strand:- start:1886 stop:2875 length:990 start_codon:yes stop_codon:yes gene_type:complete